MEGEEGTFATCVLLFGDYLWSKGFFACERTGNDELDRLETADCFNRLSRFQECPFSASMAVRAGHNPSTTQTAVDIFPPFFSSSWPVFLISTIAAGKLKRIPPAIRRTRNRIPEESIFFGWK